MDKNFFRQDSERSLFGAQRENVGIDFDKYDDIPVDLSGDGVRNSQFGMGSDSV